MQPAESKLHFIGYDVNNIQFHLNDEVKDIREFSISPSFSREIIELDNNTYDVKLSLNISSTEDNPVLFNLDIMMTGHFVLDDQSGDESFRSRLIEKNTVAIMYPFLRSIAASVTSAANLTSMLLPVINLAASFEED